MNKKKVAQAAKFSVELVIGLGVSTIVGNIVGMNTPDNISKVNKLLVVVGAGVLGSMAGDAAIEYVENKITQIISSSEERQFVIFKKL